MADVRPGPMFEEGSKAEVSAGRLDVCFAPAWPGIADDCCHVRFVPPIPEVTGESATNGQARDDHAASLLTLDLIRAADEAPSSDSPYPTSRTMRSFNG
jgi:hypothetical protein